MNHDAESRAARRSFAPLGPAHPSLQDDSTVESCLRLVGDKNASCGAETFTRGTSSRDVAAPRLVFFRPVPNAERIGLRRWHRSAVDGRASRVLLARITTRSRGQRGDPSLPSDPPTHRFRMTVVWSRVFAVLATKIMSHGAATSTRKTLRRDVAAPRLVYFGPVSQR